jgi:AraC family transcriptional regulator, transcriptional activator of pobA
MPSTTKPNFSIPYYKTINEFLATISATHITSNPNLYCLKINQHNAAIATYKPPYRKDFYFISFITNAGTTKISFDTQDATALNTFLVFQSPGLLYSYQRSPTAQGYVIYFKKECFSFFKPSFEKEFPFFDILHTNLYKLNNQQYQALQPQFADVFASYQTETDSQHTITAIKLLALLYQLKNYTQLHNQWEEGFTAPQQILCKKFIQLVNNFYIEKRTVEEYAQALHITANHLSQVVKEVTNKNALTFINDRLLEEAKSLVKYATLSIAEIAHQLEFTDPANFGKFFKKHTGQTPVAYRKAQ